MSDPDTHSLCALTRSVPQSAWLDLISIDDGAWTVSKPLSHTLSRYGTDRVYAQREPKQRQYLTMQDSLLLTN